MTRFRRGAAVLAAVLAALALAADTASARGAPADGGDLLFEAALERPSVELGEDVVLRLTATNRSPTAVDVPAFRLAHDSVSVKVAWGGETRATVTRLWGAWIEEGDRPKLRRTPTTLRSVGPGEKLVGTVAFAAVVPGALTLGVQWGPEGATRRTAGPLTVEVKPVPRAGTAPKKLVAHVETSNGAFSAELDGAAAFNAVSHFWQLARDGFYGTRELTIHRVEPGLFLQGGCPRGDGTGSTGFVLPAEGDGRALARGVFGLARGAEADSASCQFLAVADVQGEAARTLSSDFTPLGRVVDADQAAVDAICALPVDARTKRPKTPVTIVGVRAVVR